ncbi:MAG: DinB family protein [Allomuricauda sp.]
MDKLFIELVNSSHKKFHWKFGSEEPHIKVGIGIYVLMLEKLQKLQNKSCQIIEKLNKNRLNRQLTNESGEDMILYWFLLRKVLEHEIYHRGQIAAYLKVLKGESDRHSLQVN